MQVMDWNDLRYILAVSRAGTLAAAARRLAVDQTTVARRLDVVQRALGARLFDRADGALRPTKAGVAAIGHAVRIEQEVGQLDFDAFVASGQLNTGLHAGNPTLEPMTSWVYEAAVEHSF